MRVHLRPIVNIMGTAVLQGDILQQQRRRRLHQQEAKIASIVFTPTE